jgi:hypothetical protein
MRAWLTRSGYSPGTGIVRTIVLMAMGICAMEVVRIILMNI